MRSSQSQFGIFTGISNLFAFNQLSPVDTSSASLKQLVCCTPLGRLGLSDPMKDLHKLCEGLPYRLKDLHKYSDYIVNGQHGALKSFTMHKIKLFISWMLARTKGNTFQLLLNIFFPLHIKISMSSGMKTGSG